MTIRPALLAVALTFAGCAAPLWEGPVPPPTEPMPEVRSLPPAPGMVWVAGSWHWDGRAYAWIPGRWETAPPSR